MKKSAVRISPETIAIQRDGSTEKLHTKMKNIAHDTSNGADFILSVSETENAK